MKKLTSFFLAFSAFGLAQVPTTNLTGYWPFNGNANDISGNSNHGIVYGAALTCDRCGNPNSAYAFNGSNSYIEVLNASAVDVSNSTDFSICFWMRSAVNPNPNGVIVSKNLYGSWSGYQFFMNNSDPGYCTIPGHLQFYTA